MDLLDFVFLTTSVV